MSEMHTSIHDLPGGGIMARCEQDFRGLVDEYAERIQRGVDAAALDKAAGTLAGFGYVKVVRCRDCVNCYFDISSWMCGEFGFGVGNEDGGEPDGFCAWGEPRDDA